MAITKSLIKKVMSYDGRVRGTPLKTDADYVINHFGSDGLKRVESRLRALGHPIDYSSINDVGFYPFGLRILSLLVIRDVFGLSDSDLVLMGDDAPKFSLIIKLAVKFFVSLKRSMVRAPSLWAKHYSVGKLVINKVDSRAKRVVVSVCGLNHVVKAFFVYLKGYFKRFIQFSVGADVKVRLVRCRDCYKFSFWW